MAAEGIKGSLKSVKNKVEGTVAEVSQPATNVLTMVAIAGVTGAALTGAVYLWKRFKK